MRQLNLNEIAIVSGGGLILAAAAAPVGVLVGAGMTLPALLTSPLAGYQQGNGFLDGLWKMGCHATLGGQLGYELVKSAYNK
jgi:hypothetical protein